LSEETGLPESHLELAARPALIAEFGLRGGGDPLLGRRPLIDQFGQRTTSTFRDPHPAIFHDASRQLISELVA
jgi:hypothetical protein